MRVLLILLAVGVLFSCKDNSTVSVEMTTTTTNDNTTSSPTGSGSDNSSTGTTSTSGSSSDNSSITNASADNSSSSSSSSLQDLINPTVSETFGSNSNFQYITGGFAYYAASSVNIKSPTNFPKIIETNTNFYIVSPYGIEQFDKNFQLIKTFQETVSYSIYYYDITQLKNGNLLAVGSTNTSPMKGYFKIFDTDLNIISDYTHQSSSNNSFSKVAIFNDKIIIGKGDFFSTSSQRSDSENELFIFDNDTSNLLNTIESSGRFYSIIADIEIDNSTNEVLVASPGGDTYISNQVNNINQILIEKYDSNLNRIWGFELGDEANSYVFDTVFLNDSKFIVAGNFNATDFYELDSNSGSEDGILIKFDSLGNKLKILQVGNQKSDSFTSVTSNNTNIYASVCSESDILGVSNLGDYDCHILKFDNNLNPIARKTYASTGNENLLQLFFNQARDKLMVLGFSSGNLAEKLNPNASNGWYGGGLFIDYISL